jgi:SAM-dependent methyltransferase
MCFGDVAENYDRYRPKLPAAVIEWFLPLPCGVALDLGAGTGAATQALAHRAEHVIAVEPDPRMRVLLARHLPEASVLDGRAESLPLEDASVDAVLVCSAWHWIDPDRAIPEIARVLRSGGVWGIAWNSLDQDAPLVAELRRVTGHPRIEGEHGRSRRPEDIRLPLEAPFATPEVRTIPWTWDITAEDLAGLMGTYSAVVMLSAEEGAKVLERTREVIDAQPPGAEHHRTRISMACRCWKTTRI